MKIFIATVGSQGDVQPFVALGNGLQAAGHRVVVCASLNFRPLIQANGLDYAYLNDDIMNLMYRGRGGMDRSISIRNRLRVLRLAAKDHAAWYRKIVREMWAAAQELGPDLILSQAFAFVGPTLAEKLCVPAVLVQAQPYFVPTREFPHGRFPEWQLGGWYNRFTYLLESWLRQRLMRRDVNEWRAELGLPPMPWGTNNISMSDGKPIPVLSAYSRHLLPRPADWPEWAVVTGAWHLEEEASEPPGQLVRFLAAGEPPVYVGFGSMAGSDPQRLTRIALEALRLSGARGVLAKGWGGMEAVKLPEGVTMIDAAPHSWLFPRVAAVVHHGGAGTTAAGLLAGKPTIICPFGFDQPFWARRVETVGAGPAPIPQKHLTAGRLAEAITTALTDSEMKRRAAEVGELMRKEDGVGTAVREIQTFCG